MERRPLLSLGTMLGAALCLSGCATWSNTSIADPVMHERQLARDNGYCKKVAVGAAPMPSVSVQPGSSAQGVMVHGQATTYGPNGAMRRSAYSGSATPAASFGDGFASGMAQGAAVGALLLARQQQDLIYVGCMAELGWKKSSSTMASRQPTSSQAVAAPNAVPPLPVIRDRWESVGQTDDGAQLFIDLISARRSGSDVTAWVRFVLPRAAGPGPGSMVDEWRELNTFHCDEHQRSLRASAVLFQNSPLFPAEFTGDDVKRESIGAASMMEPLYRRACTR